MTKSASRQYVTGFRPVVRAREGRMLGIRQPLDGPVFDTLEDAEHWCIYAMVDHYERRLGLSDAVIYTFKGMVDCGPPPNPARLREIQRICDEATKERKGRLPKGKPS